MSKEVLVYDTVSVHLDRVNICKRIEIKGGSKRAVVSDVSDEELNSGVSDRKVKFSVDDKMSSQTQRKLQKAVRYLNFISSTKRVKGRIAGKDVKFKLCFVSVTLSSVQVHSDNIIKAQLINQFIIEIKKAYKASHYVWRCEKQLNGNVHFHFIFDVFIPWQELRELWNRIQNKLGYVDRYKERMKSLSYAEYKDTYRFARNMNEEKILAAYRKGRMTDWRYPNSTDIHSLEFINDIDKYLIKYLSKSEQNVGIEGRMWSCSQSLSDIKGGVDIVDSSLSAELNRLEESNGVRRFKDVYFTIYFTDALDLLTLNCPLLLALFKDFIMEKFHIDLDSTPS